MSKPNTKSKTDRNALSARHVISDSRISLQYLDVDLIDETNNVVHRARLNAKFLMRYVEPPKTPEEIEAYQAKLIGDMAKAREIVSQHMVQRYGSSILNSADVVNRLRAIYGDKKAEGCLYLCGVATKADVMQLLELEMVGDKLTPKIEALEGDLLGGKPKIEFPPGDEDDFNLIFHGYFRIDQKTGSVSSSDNFSAVESNRWKQGTTSLNLAYVVQTEATIYAKSIVR